MSHLSPAAAQALLRIAEADRGQATRFAPMFVQQKSGPVVVRPQIPGHEALQVGPMYELGKAGYLDIAPATSDENEYGPFQITPEGREAAASLFSPQPTAQQQNLASWETLAPIRQAIYDAWCSGGFSPYGLDLAPENVAPSLSPDEFRSALTFLRDGQMIEYRDGLGLPVPIGIKPSQKTIEELGRWPTSDPQQLAERMIAVFDAAIDNADNPAEKATLQKARDALGDISKSIVGGMAVELGRHMAGL